VAAGRRAALGHLALAFGLVASVAVVKESGVDTSDGANDNTGGNSTSGQTLTATAAEPVLGAYVALVYPRASRLRLRTELSADAEVAHLGSALSLDANLPSLPWWGASASLGLEWGAP
jgi:hypothetical protein